MRACGQWRANLLRYRYIWTYIGVRLGYVNRVLKGAKPAERPVQAPTKYETVLNTKTAKALGLQVPDIARLRANEVIEQGVVVAAHESLAYFGKPHQESTDEEIGITLALRFDFTAQLSSSASLLMSFGIGWIFLGKLNAMSSVLRRIKPHDRPTAETSPNSESCHSRGAEITPQLLPSIANTGLVDHEAGLRLFA
jgi:hypothetical protein